MISKSKLNSDFSRNVLTLMTGTTLAQAIPIAISPILTRIYAPEDFGVLALYVAIASTVGIIASGRYELAIMQPKDDCCAVHIVMLALLIAFIVSLLALAVVFLFNQPIALFLGNAAIGRWLYFLPISVLLTGIYQSLNYWNNRQKQYRYLASSRVIQSAATASTQVGLFLMTAMKSGGLVVGYISGQFVGALSLLALTQRSENAFLLNLNSKEIIDNAKIYKKYPLFSSWGALLDTAAMQLPILLISKVFGAIATGHFSMTFRVLNMPMTLISGAIAQVLLQRVTFLHNESPHKLRTFIFKISLLLTAAAIPFCVIFIVAGEYIFSFVFGDKWAIAGNYAAILSVAVAIRFVVSPLSTVLTLDHNLKKGICWQVIYFITLAITLLIVSKKDIKVFLVVFVLHELILYTVYYLIIVNAIKVDNSEVCKCVE